MLGARARPLLAGLDSDEPSRFWEAHATCPTDTLGDEMLWTCACCGYQRVKWTPRTWTEAQVSAVVRARCEGKNPRVLKGARGFVYLGARYAPDRPLTCPSCQMTFYPGDSVISPPPERVRRPRRGPRARARAAQ